MKIDREKLIAVHKTATGKVAIAAVGIAIGIIFAPKSGMEVREDIQNKAVNAVETVNDYAKNASKEIGNVINRFNGKTKDVKNEIKDRL